MTKYTKYLSKRQFIKYSNKSTSNSFKTKTCTLKLQGFYEIQRYLQVLQHISQNSQPPFSLVREFFLYQKRFYLKLTVDPINLDRPPSKVGIIPYKMLLHYMCPTAVTHNIMSLKSNNFKTSTSF